MTMTMTRHISCGCSVNDVFTLSEPIDPLAQSRPKHAPATRDRMLQSAKALYTPIQSWQTRIIRLHPGNLDEPLVCDLVVAELIAFNGVGLACEWTIVEYEALSYSWGYPSFTDTILCNGVEHPITHHLANALRQLRFNNSVRYLWVDAFCINQYDIGEKSRQVSIMLQIFQKAKDVLVWLGLAEGDEFRTLSSLKLLSGYNVSEIISTKEQKRMGNSYQSHQILCNHHQEWLVGGVTRLLEKPWFSRTWVRQEVAAAANDIMVWCGPFKVSFGVLTKGITILRRLLNAQGLEFHHTTSGDVPRFECFDTLTTSTRLSKSTVSGIPQVSCPTFIWLDTIIAGAKFKATDPRDRVFGLVGMLPNLAMTPASKTPSALPTRRPSPYPIDYMKTETEVYTDLVKHLVNEMQNLHALCIFQDRKSPKPDLPTWAIDLRADRLQMVPRNYHAYSMRDMAATSDLDESQIVGVFKMDRLQLTGFIFGELTTQASMLNIGWEKNGAALKYGHGIASEFAFENTLTRTPAHLVERYCYIPYQVRPRGIVDRPGLTVFVSDAAKPGDVLVILNGGDCFPFVLRTYPSQNGCYTFLGPALFTSRTNGGHGYYYEAWSRESCFSTFDKITRKSVQKETFTLL
jgi:hypothetical protein